MKRVCDHRSESQFKQLRKSPKKRDFGASTGFEPRASALALQCSTSLSYEDPYTGGRPFSLWHLGNQNQVSFQRKSQIPNSIQDSIVELCLTLQILENEAYDESVDWWSFGVSFYRMLTGEVCIQLFRERLSEKSVKVHATIQKGSLGSNKYSFH